MSWLLDTCALSEYVRKAPAPQVIAWLDEQDEASLFISVISLGEIEKGILKLRKADPRRSQKLTAWLGKVEQRFAGRIVPLDAAALHVWAQFTAQAELGGQPLPVMDALLMASAQCHGLTIVTTCGTSRPIRRSSILGRCKPAAPYLTGSPTATSSSHSTPGTMPGWPSRTGAGTRT